MPTPENPLHRRLQAAAEDRRRYNACSDALRKIGRRMPARLAENVTVFYMSGIGPMAATICTDKHEHAGDLIREISAILGHEHQPGPDQQSVVLGRRHRAVWQIGPARVEFLYPAEAG